ncbi:hypothetical protein D1298_20155 [Salmonella enterica]|nr:hypothetical protein [Salmonella enterica]EAP9281275.1 hypothetical protein [Salmonella enterica]EBK4509292.1 hypothetical protein [Salmonella enterica]EBM5749446.1 hypothetical protein [Salmonella enterica]
MQKMTGEDGYFHAREELINDDSGRAEMQKARLVRSGFMLSGAELVALAGGERSTSNAVILWPQASCVNYHLTALVK